jgi:two-component system OmpR family response regulator
MKKIFLLEDSSIVSELLKFELESEFDCAVICFINGSDLLANLNEEPDLIILDYFIDNAFNENGLDIMNRVKSVNDKLPLIIFSGQHNLKLAIQLIHAGAVDYIDKNEDNFLVDINNAVRNVFNYGEAKKQLTRTQEKISVDRKQILTFGILGLVLLVSLLIV